MSLILDLFLVYHVLLWVIVSAVRWHLKCLLSVFWERNFRYLSYAWEESREIDGRNKISPFFPSPVFLFGLHISPSPPFFVSVKLCVDFYIICFFLLLKKHSFLGVIRFIPLPNIFPVSVLMTQYFPSFSK